MQTGEFLSRRNLALFAFCALGLGGVAFFLLDGKSTRFGYDVESDRAYWEKRIERVGGQRAYAELADSLTKHRGESVEDMSYRAAHIFAVALYAVEGPDAVGVCDERFGRGCLHEFMGQAVLDKGISYAQDMLEICALRWPAQNYYCAQALGHGFLLSFADEKSLVQALRACDALNPSELVTSCYIGVFYEYDLQVNKYVGAVQLRELNSKTALNPCTSLAGGKAKLCYYTRALWWYSSLNDNPRSAEEIAQTMLGFCRTAPRDRNAYICRTGVARYVPQIVGFDVPRSIALCAYAFPKEISMCRHYSASLLLVESGKEEALEMCEGLTGSALTNCRGVIENPYYGSQRRSP